MEELQLKPNLLDEAHERLLAEINVAVDPAKDTTVDHGNRLLKEYLRQWFGIDPLQVEAKLGEIVQENMTNITAKTLIDQLTGDGADEPEDEEGVLRLIAQRTFELLKATSLEMFMLGYMFRQINPEMVNVVSEIELPEGAHEILNADVLAENPRYFALAKITAQAYQVLPMMADGQPMPSFLPVDDLLRVVHTLIALIKDQREELNLEEEGHFLLLLSFASMVGGILYARKFPGETHG